MMLRLFLLGLLAAPAVCNIPVFRYALERWRPSVYELVLFHRGPLSAPQRAVLDRLRDVRANVEIDRVDLASDLDPRWKKLLPTLKTEPPFVVLFYPGSDAIAWQGSLDDQALAVVLDSPVRRETARRLLAGDSTVWLFLPCGKPEEDAAARAVLVRELARLEGSLKLPPRLPSDPPLLSDAPVKLSFPILDLRRDDPAEAAFAQLLLRSDTDLQGPVVFPVFGRGRALWALAGKGIQAATIQEAAAFLAGACSCEAKELNPGLDLVFATDWEAAVGAALPDAPTPPVLLKPRSAPAPVPVEESSAPSPLLRLSLVAAGVLVLITGWRLLKGRA